MNAVRFAADASAGAMPSLPLADIANLRTACLTSRMQDDPAWRRDLDALAEQPSQIRDARERESA